MYVGVMLILTGEAVFFMISGLWIYLMFVFIDFNLFIILIEEKRLKKDFGNDSVAYCESVRRWLKFALLLLKMIISMHKSDFRLNSFYLASIGNHA
jgi:protein-S-isoprenylcysteine O-methyltransferase Ste14